MGPKGGKVPPLLGDERGIWSAGTPSASSASENLINTTSIRGLVRGSLLSLGSPPAALTREVLTKNVLGK